MRGQCKGKLPCNIIHKQNSPWQTLQKRYLYRAKSLVPHLWTVTSVGNQVLSLKTWCDCFADVRGRAAVCTVSSPSIASPSSVASVYKIRKSACHTSSIPWWQAVCRLHMLPQAGSVGCSEGQGPRTHLRACLPRPATVHAHS